MEQENKEQDFYYLAYRIRRSLTDNHYHAYLEVYTKERLHKITYKQPCNAFFQDYYQAQNYVLKRIRHHREEKPCKFVGELHVRYHRLPDMEVLYMIPKKKEKRDDQRKN